MLLQLSIKQEKVTDQFCHVLVTFLDFVIEWLLVVFVKLKTAHNDLLTDVQQWYDKSTFALSHCAVPRAQILVLVFALLVQKDVL